MILIKKRFKLFVHAKIEQKVGLPKYYPILFDRFNKKSLPSFKNNFRYMQHTCFFDLHQQYGLFYKKN